MQQALPHFTDLVFRFHVSIFSYVKKTYEIEFQSSEQADLDTISICLKKKSKYLASKLEDPLYVSTFEKPSQFFLRKVDCDW